MHEIVLPPDKLVSRLLSARSNGLCILDSCAVRKPGSNRLIAGIQPVQIVRLTETDPRNTLQAFDELMSSTTRSAIFTISYDFGRKLNRFPARPTNEPDIFVALFDSLVVHDYDEGKTVAVGEQQGVADILELLAEHQTGIHSQVKPGQKFSARSNFTKSEYIDAVEKIRELIRAGETYQTNLTQQLTVGLSDGESPRAIFSRLRAEHPAPFAAFLDRGDSVVVSASPEEFIRIGESDLGRIIFASPIKGTRPRGANEQEDKRLRAELASSEKDRAENTMIVDLMRNDLGRVCKFGSVRVEDLNRIEEHPSLFHLVSRVRGELLESAAYSDILRAVFPCGSITGAPKIRTMDIIDRLEPDPRGLSMGAIGCRIPAGLFGPAEIFEMSVAIRTIVFRDRTATFNVGGGVVIDSDPQAEYDESLLKAQALLRSMNASLD